MRQLEVQFTFVMRHGRTRRSGPNGVSETDFPNWAPAVLSPSCRSCCGQHILVVVDGPRWNIAGSTSRCGWIQRDVFLRDRRTEARLPSRWLRARLSNRPVVSFLRWWKRQKSSAANCKIYIGFLRARIGAFHRRHSSLSRTHSELVGVRPRNGVQTWQPTVPSALLAIPNGAASTTASSVIDIRWHQHVLIDDVELAILAEISDLSKIWESFRRLKAFTSTGGGEKTGKVSSGLEILGTIS